MFTGALTRRPTEHLSGLLGLYLGKSLYNVTTLSTCQLSCHLACYKGLNYGSMSQYLLLCLVIHTTDKRRAMNLLYQHCFTYASYSSFYLVWGFSLVVKIMLVKLFNLKMGGGAYGDGG